jgi:hypothetical protein
MSAMGTSSLVPITPTARARTASSSPPPPRCRSSTRTQAEGELDEGIGEGPFGWIWIVGEPGIGEARLAAEVARLAPDRGRHVLFGRNGEDLRVLDQPFIKVLRQSPASVTGTSVVLWSALA